MQSYFENALNVPNKDTQQEIEIEDPTTKIPKKVIKLTSDIRIEVGQYLSMETINHDKKAIGMVER